MLVSDECLQWLEAENLVGIVFMETATKAENRPIKSWAEIGREPMWKLASKVSLPRLSPRCKVVDRNGEPYEDDTDYASRGVVMLEGECRSWELHYRRGDLEQIGAFDVARTLEPIDFVCNLDRRRLIVSRRLREFLLRHKIKADWKPVYIDDE